MPGVYYYYNGGRYGRQLRPLWASLLPRFFNCISPPPHPPVVQALTFRLVQPPGERDSGRGQQGSCVNSQDLSNIPVQSVGHVNLIKITANCLYNYNILNYMYLHVSAPSLSTEYQLMMSSLRWSLSVPSSGVGGDWPCLRLATLEAGYLRG
jgi:hypothetical protein